VAVWATMSRLVQVTVSPALTPVGAAPNAILSTMTTWFRPRVACAGRADRAAATGKSAADVSTPRRDRFVALASADMTGQRFGMGLMLAKQSQAAFQQSLQFGVMGVRNQRPAQRLIDRAVKAHLIVDIGLVEGHARQSGQPFPLSRGGLRQGGRGGIGFRRHL